MRIDRERFRTSALAIAVLIAGMLLMLTSETYGQSTSATISGTVVDPAGAVVPDAKITLTNINTNFRRQVTTSKEGYFALPQLEPGKYKLQAQREGFRLVEVRDIVLNTNDRRDLQIKLAVGRATESITVDANAISVDTSAAVGTVVDRNFVESLPLNGRSFQSLILLTPGVVITNASAISPGQFSVNGQRADANYFMVDGVGANLYVNQGYSMDGSGPGLTASGGSNNLVSVDALEEFKIQTSTYAAEFGRQPGGQVSLVSRSGKNRFQGTLFENLRNEVMDAREYFTRLCGATGCTSSKKPPLRQNQFGGTFSGPIWIPSIYDGHDRTFFFYSYEDQRLRLPQSGITYVPSLSERQSAALALQPIFKALPIPNGVDLGTGWAAYNYSLSDPGAMRTHSVRLDHTFSSKLTTFLRYNDSTSNRTTHYFGSGTNSGYPTTPYDTASSTRTLTLTATATLSSNLNNEFRVNFSRQQSLSTYKNDPFGGAEPISLDTLISGYNGPGDKYVGAAINLNSRYISLSMGQSFDLWQRQMNLVDNLSWVKGPHQFKFGVDWRHMSPIYGPREYYQSLTFSRQTDIETGIITSVSINSYPTANLLYNNLSLFAQDTWKVARRTTLDLGLRWELNPGPSEASGKKPVMVTGVTNDRNAANATLAPADSPFYKTFYRAFAPRVGVAYRLNQRSGLETVLRGGFGVFYALGSGQASMGYAFGFPNVATKSQTNLTFPILPSLAGPPSMPEVKLPLAGAAYSLNPDLKLPYTLQWNLALEQSLGSQQSITMSYVASAGRRLLTTQNINAPKGYTYGGPRPNSNFQYIYFTANGPSSDYHSFQTQYKARLKRGLQALVNYTWSHAIDEVSNELQGYDLERGNASFDLRHNFSAALTYQLPKLRETGPLAAPIGRLTKAVVNDWSIDTILHAQTGRPLNVTSQTYVDDEGAMVTGRPDVVPGQPFYISDASVAGGRRFNVAAFSKPPSNLTYPGLPARQGNMGRNVVRELSIYQADIALGRTFRFTENWKLLFKAEMFNVLNHPLFGTYNLTYNGPTTNPSTFGVPTASLNRALGGLNSLYQMGGPRSIQLSLKLSF